MLNSTPIGLIFDDGFIKSTLATAALFEEFSLSACFAVIAEPGEWACDITKGDFALWNELQARGHYIAPHGFTHARLSELPHARAVEQIDRCLAVLGEKLNGFRAADALYCFAYNSSTPALNQYLLPRVRAIRHGGSGFLNQRDLASRIWHCDAIGPHDPAKSLLDLIEQARRRPPEAFLFTLHGLDGEGWGAIASDQLRRVLELIITDKALTYWPLSSAPPGGGS